MQYTATRKKDTENNRCWVFKWEGAVLQWHTKLNQETDYLGFNPGFFFLWYLCMIWKNTCHLCQFVRVALTKCQIWGEASNRHLFPTFWSWTCGDQDELGIVQAELMSYKQTGATCTTGLAPHPTVMETGRMQLLKM